MNLSFFRKLSVSNLALGVGFFLIPALFVFAQTVDNQAVFDDLSKLTGQEVTRLEQAKAICNVEQFITECAEIGKKYGLYTTDEQKQVDSVLLELKGKVVEDLKNCSTEECLVSVASQLAKNFASRNPALGRQLDLTTAKVEEKKIIVETAKEIGITVDQCRTMDPDTASIELLRSCARLAKDSRVQKYIPEDARRLAEVSDTSLDLQEALRKGEYQCGNNTLDGCGNFCLNPSQGIQAPGVSTIPPVCRQIAEKFFGQDGVQQLESAYTKVNSASDYYKKKAEAVTFRTQDGRVLTSPVDIGRYMEDEMRNGNIEAIRSGMDFMVTRGFVRPEDRDFAIKMAQKAREQGGSFDFNSCDRDPKSCQNFIPEDERKNFNAMENIHRIMSEEMRKLGVPSPESCENNPQYGEACVKAARAALPQIEEIAKNFAPARGIVEDIRRHISFSDGASDARKRAEEEFKKGSGGVNIGDRVFSNFNDMEAFCRNNGSLCLTEAAKKGFINKDYAASRYENTFGPPRSSAGGVFPPGQTPGFTAPGPGFGPPPGFNKEEALKQFQQWLDNPIGAPPVPTRGFPGGPHTPGGDPFNQQSSFCPAFSPAPPCPTGQYRPELRDERGCYFPGACISISQPLPPQSICPQDQYWNGSACVSNVKPQQCPAGQYWFVPYGGREGYCKQSEQQTQCPVGQYWFVPYGGGAGYCKPNEQQTSCPAGQYWFVPPSGSGYCKANEQPNPGTCSQELINLLGSGCHSMDNAFFDTPMTKYVFFGATAVNECRTNYIRNCTVGQAGSGQVCPSGQYWNGSACVASTTTYDDCPTKYGTGWHTMDTAGTCFNPSMTEYRTSNGTLYQCSTTPVSGCSGTTTTTTTSGQKNQVWNSFGLSSSIRTDADPARIEQLKQACANVPSGSNIWLPESGNSASVDFGMPSAEKCTAAASCAAGTYFNGTSCVASTTATTCPSGQYWNGTYCVASTATSTTTTACPSGQYWNGTSCVINPSPTTTTCPSGQTWNGTYCVASTTTSSYCPSFAHEMSGYCMLNNDTTRCAEYPNASTEGNYMAAVCQQHTGTTSTTTTCPSGQYWNGTACVTSTTTTTTTACNNNNVCDSGESSGSCPSDCSSSTTTTSSCSTPSTCFDSAICTSSGWYWYNSGCWSAPQTTTSTSTSCPSGQYWSGTACVTSTSPTPTTTACPSGQYWNGTACVTSNSPTPTTTTCPSGQYWNGTACVTSTSPPSSFLPSSFCPRNHNWNGSYCIVRKQSVAHFIAQIRTSGWQFIGALGAIFEWK